MKNNTPEHNNEPTSTSECTQMDQDDPQAYKLLYQSIWETQARQIETSDWGTETVSETLAFRHKQRL